MSDDDLRRLFLEVLRQLVDLQTTVTAMGIVGQQLDPQYEARVGAARQPLAEKSARVLALFEQVDADEWLRLLRAMRSGPVQ